MVQQKPFRLKTTRQPDMVNSLEVRILMLAISDMGGTKTKRGDWTIVPKAHMGQTEGMFSVFQGTKDLKFTLDEPTFSIGGDTLGQHT